jgi:hypothetical protein
MSVPTREQFSRDGFVLIRRLLDEPDVAFYIERLRGLAGDKTRWTLPDGVSRHRDFWPVIFNERLLATVRAMLGDGICYLPHNDLHVGFSSFSWHRDSVTRGNGSGADWDESVDPYRLVRVGIYLQRFEDSRFKLGLIRGSHVPDSKLPGAVRERLRYKTSAAANVLSGLSGINLVGDEADWVATEPGDCVIFDPRVLHTGTKFHGNKFSIFVAYGIPNSHFLNHWHYYLHMRTDLGYSPLDPELADRLRTAGLLAVAPAADRRVDDAWLPSPTFTAVARKFK